MNNQTIEAFPLCWPLGWNRLGTFKYRDPSRFTKKPFGSVRDSAIHEIELLGGKSLIISSNIPLKKDGMPSASFRPPTDPGIAIYFTLKGKRMVFACDEWPTVTENLHAIRKTIEAIRGIKRWGASDMLERAFTGFTAIDAPLTESDCWNTLEISRYSSLEIINKAKRKLALKYHPDITGGSAEKMAVINNAYDECIKLNKDRLP